MINQTIAIYWLLDCLSAPLHFGCGEPRAWCCSNLPRQSTNQASKEIAMVRLVISSRQHLGGGEPRTWQFNSSRSPSVPRTSRGCNRSFKNLNIVPRLIIQVIPTIGPTNKKEPCGNFTLPIIAPILLDLSSNFDWVRNNSPIMDLLSGS